MEAHGTTTELASTQQLKHRLSSASIAPLTTTPNRKDGARLEFRDISFDVTKRVGNRLIFWKTHKEPKRILDSISGIVEPGDLVALMGASGAGKSTLLNILSRRIVSHEGEVLVNGVPAEQSPIMKTSTCYIQQEDLFYGFITVTEHLEQQATFRIPLPRSQRQERIQDVMDRFSLNKSRNSLIGNIAQGARRGISGGEKKRLSVATELLINPSLIFADEPTSGLDAFMAASVVETLKTLADSGHTVVTTIHQPSSDVFALFTKLLLLAEGRVIYYGPRLGAIAYFLRLGHPCPPYTNPADHFIELISIDWENPGPKLEELDKWHTTWKQCSQAFLREWETELAEKFTMSLTSGDYPTESPGYVLQNNAHHLPDEKPFEYPLDAQGNPKRPAFSKIALTLLKRCVISTTRNPSVVRARLIQTIITALLGGFVYFRLKESAHHSKSGACFFILVNLGFMMTFTAVTTFMADKTIVLRERDAGLYGLATYFWAKIVSDMMLQFYLPIIYSCICWYLMGLNDEFWRFLAGTCFIFLMSLSVASIGYIVASFSPHLGVAVALGPVLLLPFLMVSGFVIQKSSLPYFWHWLYHLSPFVYGFSGLMRATFLDVKFKNVPVTPPGTEAAIMYYSGNEVLQSYSIATDKQRWVVDIIALLLWLFLGRCVAMILFMWANRRRKK